MANLPGEPAKAMLKYPHRMEDGGRPLSKCIALAGVPYIATDLKPSERSDTKPIVWIEIHVPSVWWHNEEQILAQFSHEVLSKFIGEQRQVIICEASIDLPSESLDLEDERATELDATAFLCDPC